MRNDISQKSIGRICALVVIGMFIAMTSLSVSANDPDDWTYGGDSWGADGRIGSNDNYAVIIEINNNDRMTITNGGNVGIGTTSPVAILDVDPTVTTATDLTVIRSDTTLNSPAQIMTNWYGLKIDPPLIVSGGITNKYALVTAEGAGNVGIGTTSPDTELHVNGDIKQKVTTSDVSNPPTDAQLDTLFGIPASNGDGWTTYLKDSDSDWFYQIVAVGTEWYIFTAPIAV